MRNAKQIDGASVPPNSAPSDKNVAGVKMISLRIVISLMRRITEAMGSRYARIMEDRASRNTTPTSGRPFEHEQSATRSLGIPQLGQRILEAAKRVPALSTPSMNEQKASMKQNEVTQLSEVIHYGDDIIGRPAEIALDLVRERAYQLFEAHGRQEGFAVNNWLEAEREIERQLQLWELYEIRPLNRRFEAQRFAFAQNPTGF